MTKREKLQKAFDTLFDGFTVDEFLEIVGKDLDIFCSACRYQDECDRAFFETDDNGEFILDEDGDEVIRDSLWRCEDIYSIYIGNTLRR